MSRLEWVVLGAAEPETGAEVVQGLSQNPKSLPCRYFYDHRGSLLFEQICDLPEYYPTRTERQLLAQYGAEIAQYTRAQELIELGSGSARKTRLLLEACSPEIYCPIDVSDSILKTSSLELLAEYPQLRVRALVGTYDQALTHIPKLASSSGSRMIVFLGSTLGNLPPTACGKLLSQIRSALQPGEFLLLGVDLQKPMAILEAAYNDSQGVTAAFNLNLLSHLNWRFQGNFQPDQFCHRAIYNQQTHQIEMYLDAQAPQMVTLAALDYRCFLEQGESICTEISRKFDLASLAQDLEGCGFRVVHTWQDKANWFSLVLTEAH